LLRSLARFAYFTPLASRQRSGALVQPEVLVRKLVIVTGTAALLGACTQTPGPVAGAQSASQAGMSAKAAEPGEKKICRQDVGLERVDQRSVCLGRVLTFLRKLHVERVVRRIFVIDRPLRAVRTPHCDEGAHFALRGRRLEIEELADDDVEVARGSGLSQSAR